MMRLFKKRKEIYSNEYELLFNRVIELRKMYEELNIKIESCITQIRQLRGRLNAKVFKEEEEESNKYEDGFDIFR